jgi:ribosomal protein L29
MKLKQIVTQSNTELTTLVTDSRKSLATLAIDMRTKQVTGVKQIAGHKKTIARALTVLRQRELSPEGDK